MPESHCGQNLMGDGDSDKVAAVLGTCATEYWFAKSLQLQRLTCPQSHVRFGVVPVVCEPLTMWSEIDSCRSSNRHGFKLAGPALTKRLSETHGAVPEALFSELASLLTSLELTDSRELTLLPPAISQLTTLYDLVLSQNALNQLPVELGGLPVLRTLIVEGNTLEELPASMGRLCHLQTLNVSKNQLASLPDSFTGMTELSYLNIGSNKLSEVPPCLLQLPRLSVLLASHNSITYIPPGLTALPGLSELDLSCNSITHVPQELAECGKLKTLVLLDNPFADKKLPKVLKEGKLKGILSHIKKHGLPPSKETLKAEAAAAALEKAKIADR